MRTKLNIEGTVRRRCLECGKYADCNVFEHEGKQRMLCPDCTFKEFNSKPKKNSFVEYVFCKHCQGLTMKENKAKTRATDTQMFKYFECEKCGRTLKGKVKLRRMKKCLKN